MLAGADCSLGDWRSLGCVLNFGAYSSAREIVDGSVVGRIL